MRAVSSPSRRRLTALLTLAGLLLLPAGVLSHAQLVSADPAPDSTLDTPPSRVAATFNDELDGGKSSLVLVGPDGQTVATGGVAADDLHVLAVPVPPLGPGTYEVRWTAATADGHIERGTYRFTVAAVPTAGPTITAPPSSTVPSAGPSSTPTPTPTPTPEPLATPPPTGGSGGDSGFGLVVAAAVAGLLLGGVIGWWRRRQSR